VKLGVVLGFAALAIAAAAPAQAAAPGVVYRKSWSGTPYFHPLASFGNLNRAITAGERRRADRLAAVLLARGTKEHGKMVWRYHDRRDGPATWESGLAQAVAAQALARAGRMKAARLAFNAIPGRLLISLPQGPWIKLYGYSDVVVLNAQLQATLSIADYARLAHDARAEQLARSMRRATLVLLPRFDTGAWSTYSLGGRDSPLSYHEYVTSLLWKFARRTHGWRWTAYASRFRSYRHTPPKLRRGDHPPTIYPLPRDGFRDAAAVRFWLSKPATVTLRVAGGRWSGAYGRGWQTFWWRPTDIGPGRYGVWATAVDRAGNVAVRQLRSVVVLRDTTPPDLRAEVTPWRVYWHATDRTSPWLDLRLRLTAPGLNEVVELGRVPLEGSLPLALSLDPSWTVTVVAADSTGNATARSAVEPGDAPRLGRL
jgi:D-glucuronyl C5-epimerase-like protein